MEVCGFKYTQYFCVSLLKLCVVYCEWVRDVHFLPIAVISPTKCVLLYGHVLFRAGNEPGCHFTRDDATWLLHLSFTDVEFHYLLANTNPLKSLQPDIMCPVRRRKGSRGLIGENGNCVCGLIALSHYTTVTLSEERVSARPQAH